MNRDVRRAQYHELIVGLGEKLGVAGFDLTSQFHHIIWCGDFNYRVVELDGSPMPADHAAALLRAGSNQQMFRDHDQLRQEIRAQEAFAVFQEPQPHPHFIPTYKKFEGRPPTDFSTEDWVDSTYRMKFKEAMYKGGKVKERTPGYCDRVLYHSLISESSLIPERQVFTTELVMPPTSTASGATLQVECDNYVSVNDGEAMSASDHSPVFAVFELSTKHQHLPSSGVLASPSVRIELIDIQVKGNIENTSVEVLFPAPWEVADGLLCAKSNKQSNGWKEEQKARAGCRHYMIDDGPGFYGAPGAIPTLRLSWDTAGASAVPAGLSSLHLVFKVNGGSFVTVGHQSGSKETPMKDLFSCQCSVPFSALMNSPDVVRTFGSAGSEKEAMVRLHDLPLFNAGRPAFYPPGTKEQLGIDVTIRVLTLQ